MWSYVVMMVLAFVGAGSLLTVAYYERRRRWMAIWMVLAALALTAMGLIMIGPGPPPEG